MAYTADPEIDRIAAGWRDSAYDPTGEGIQQYLSSVGAPGWNFDGKQTVTAPNGRKFDWIGNVGQPTAQKRTGFTTDARYAAVTGSKPGASSAGVGQPKAAPVEYAPPQASAPSIAAPAEGGQSIAPVRDPRLDELYNMLLGRAKQGLGTDRNDPAVKAQADAYSANAERARRDYLADLAESDGPNANLRSEQRMTAEQVGQDSGRFEAELVSRVIEQKRAEIMHALDSMRGQLTVEQELALQQKLAEMNDITQRLGISTSAATSKYNTDVNAATSRYGIATGASTARRGQDLGWESELLGNDQFMRQLGFSQSQADRDYDLRNRGL
jgi:hypothetical protein